MHMGTGICLDLIPDKNPTCLFAELLCMYVALFIFAKAYYPPTY